MNFKIFFHPEIGNFKPAETDKPAGLAKHFLTIRMSKNNFIFQILESCQHVVDNPVCYYRLQCDLFIGKHLFNYDLSSATHRGHVFPGRITVHFAFSGMRSDLLRERIKKTVPIY